MKKLVIFDLDGTLLNTVADLANSTNFALEKCGFPTHPATDYKSFVGNGINKLFERALPEGLKTKENVGKVRAWFIPHYDKHNADASTPYPGVVELLKTLEKEGVSLAIASNKYQTATEKLINHYFGNISFTAVLGQRETIPIKPDPAIVYEILKKTGIEKEDCLYVGDSGVDMQTAFHAGITSVGVTWGFRPQKELEENKACFIVDSAEEIQDLVKTL